MNSVEYMQESLLCTGCGTCSGICPKKAIEMKSNTDGFYKPSIDDEECDSCGSCLRVCPALKKPEKNFSQQEDLNKNKSHPVVGGYRNIYTGYSEDDKLRKDCSSGGIVTSFLYYLLEKNIIDYVVVVTQSDEDVFRFQPRLTSSKKDVIESSGSKYIPVPQSNSVSQILEHDGRCAFVGLPCHLQGLQNAMERQPELKDKIKFKVSLFCGGTTSINATKYLLRSLDVPPERVSSIDFRGGGWPGRFRIEMKDGSLKMISYRDIRAMGGVYSSPLYRPFFCSLCSDPFGFFSDISLGDPWHEEEKSDLGKNIIISRNENIDKILNEMKDEGVIKLEKKKVEDVLASNPSLVRSKYDNIQQKSKVFQKIYKEELEPKIFSDNLESSRFDKISIYLFFIIKKYLTELDPEKVNDDFPLFGFRMLKLINLLERGM